MCEDWVPVFLEGILASRAAAWQSGSMLGFCVFGGGVEDVWEDE